MHPVEVVDTAEIPGGGQLRLLRSGPEYSIRFGEDELMGSEAPQSEKALATLAHLRMGARRDRVLIGGLGMGFTLGAALNAFPDSTKIVVAELVPQVVTWANGPLAHLFGNSLTDPRVTLEIRDVHDVIAEAPEGFDGILLDVDNGPDGFIHVANDRLYCNWGLRSAHAALRPGGVLAIWSAYIDDAFVGRLEQCGFAVEQASIPAECGRDRSPYTIWFASKAE
ncbi:spermidine synthase [Sphingomonas sp. Leaf357]|uniref:spermidine synthase n=1 Tax=Sphingomonas sp. Leaf357 TaxID=1736350 RepID=UPI0006FE5223|nr:spermidine synthase [Sphingomonas sp. Leaf357]KQS03842.1 spermidine synthase [Sphingomonas sp. Leaf357]